MRDIIEIEKEEIPYNFDIVLDNDEYNLEFQYNQISDLFTCTLSKEDEVLVYNEPLIYGVPLFNDIDDSENFPYIRLIPYDISQQENEVTYKNFEETVFLTIDDNFSDTEEESVDDEPIDI